MPMAIRAALWGSRICAGWRPEAGQRSASRRTAPSSSSTPTRITPRPGWRTWRRNTTPQLAGKYGFRPANQSTAPTGLVSAKYGANPAEPKVVLGLPEPKVLGKIRALWHQDRRPANIMLVLDNSGSMGDNNKIDQARAGL